MFEGISDIHLNDKDLEDSLLFPGPKRAGELGSNLKTLRDRCEASRKADFMVTADNMFFRGRREDHAVDGVWYHLRRMPSIPPDLDTLPTRLPSYLMKALLSPVLINGGLVYITGAPGVGKTTTGSATVVSRLKEFGGFAYTVEDPPEMPLNGWHSKGYCRQTWVAGEDGSDWAESLRGILRSQPVGTPTILYVGEVRDGEAAAAMLRAAANGFLVIATGFALDIPSGIDSLVRLCGEQQESVRLTLSGVLRVVVNQKLQNKQVSATTLISSSGNSQVAAKLRSGQFAHLASDIQFQANQAMLGCLPFNDK